MAFPDGNVTNVNAYRLAVDERKAELDKAQAAYDDAKSLLKDKEAEEKAAEEDAKPQPAPKPKAKKPAKKKAKKSPDTPETVTRLNANAEEQKSYDRRNRPTGPFRVQNNSTGKTGADF